MQRLAVIAAHVRPAAAAVGLPVPLVEVPSGWVPCLAAAPVSIIMPACHCTDAALAPTVSQPDSPLSLPRAHSG